ncbi:hypothetical protein ACFWVF_18550 [Streptomyces sp. NPDC058659]|uniref:hypothetical protein n=1 Tax=unclassified Streptomyces TaxID=2593676 RepID=UPI00365BA0D4
MPGKELFLEFDTGYTEALFGVVNLRDVTMWARLYVRLDAPDEPSFDDYVPDSHDSEDD